MNAKISNQDLKPSKYLASLIYIGDPMCSWCWGISDHVEALAGHFSQKLKFKVLLGGLRPGGGETWNQAFKDILKGHWEHVAELSGKPFNHGLFELPEFDYNTEPACRAVRIVRDMRPEIEFQFFKSIQKHFYVDNANPCVEDFYLPLINEFNLNKDQFLNRLHSDTYRTLVSEDFNYTRQIGVYSYPTLLFERNHEFKLISVGYAVKEEMEKRINELLF